MFDTILCATDFSERSRDALSRARELARAHDATLHVVHAIEPAPTVAHFGGGALRDNPAARQPSLEKDLDAMLESLPEATGHVRIGRASDAIVEAAEELGADLVVMGTHGRSGLKRLVLGSTAEQTLRRAHVPVLAVPPAEA